MVLETLRAWREFEAALSQVAEDLDLAWLFGAEARSTSFRQAANVASPSKMLTYPDSWTMFIWHAYRVTTISLHTSLVQIYNVLDDSSLDGFNELQRQSAVNMRHRSLAIIDDMNEDICASISWSLGEVGQEHNRDLPSGSRASLSIAALKSVVNGIHTRQQHLVQAKEALNQIAYRFGIRAALEPSRG